MHSVRDVCAVIFFLISNTLDWLRWFGGDDVEMEFIKNEQSWACRGFLRERVGTGERGEGGGSGLSVR